MRYSSKQAFIESIVEEWKKLWELLAKISDRDMTAQKFWGAGWNAKDVLMHLHEWHAMCLRWYKEGLTGEPVMPAKGYKWSECPALNKAIQAKHQRVPLAEARKKVKSSHAKALRLLKSLSEEELLKPGYHAWCGKAKKLPLTSYFHANTSGHYRWAQRKLKPLIRR